MTVHRLIDLAALPPLAAAARAEGFRFLDLLIDKWAEGTNCFDGRGEALFGAFVGDELVGTAGLTRQDDHLGRVRRVYVRPDHRRLGIAEALMRAVLGHARPFYDALVLYAETPEAFRLYQSLGFVEESSDGPDHATHRLALHRFR